MQRCGHYNHVAPMEQEGFSYRLQWHNQPAAGNAGFAPRLTIEHHWSGVPEPGRSETIKDPKI